MKKISDRNKYLITAGAGLLTAIVMMLIRGILSAGSGREVFRILADSFTFPGGILLIIGGVIWIMNQGGFDGLFYMTRSLFKTRTQGKEGSVSENEEGRVESYADFIVRRHTENQVKGYGYLPLCGVWFLILAGVCVLLYYSV